MKVVTISQEEGLCKKSFPKAKIVCAESIDLAFRMLSQGDIDSAFLSGLDESTIINLMKYDFVVTRSLEHDEKLFFLLGKFPKKPTGDDSSSFLIFSDHLRVTKNKIELLIREAKIPIIRFEDLILQEGNTPLYLLEVKGHIEDGKLSLLIKDMHTKYLLKHLGSYPSHDKNSSSSRK